MFTPRNRSNRKPVIAVAKKTNEIPALLGMMQSPEDSVWNNFWFKLNRDKTKQYNKLINTFETNDDNNSQFIAESEIKKKVERDYRDYLRSINCKVSEKAPEFYDLNKLADIQHPLHINPEADIMQFMLYKISQGDISYTAYLATIALNQKNYDIAFFVLGKIYKVLENSEFSGKSKVISKVKSLMQKTAGNLIGNITQQSDSNAIDEEQEEVEESVESTLNPVVSYDWQLFRMLFSIHANHKDFLQNTISKSTTQQTVATVVSNCILQYLDYLLQQNDFRQLFYFFELVGGAGLGDYSFFKYCQKSSGGGYMAEKSPSKKIIIYYPDICQKMRSIYTLRKNWQINSNTLCRKQRPTIQLWHGIRKEFWQQIQFLIV